MDFLISSAYAQAAGAAQPSPWSPVTNGGILGRVDEVGDAFLAIEIAEKVIIRVQKNSIAAVLPKGTLKAS